jgi:hypothetical protein
LRLQPSLQIKIIKFKECMRIMTTINHKIQYTMLKRMKRMIPPNKIKYYNDLEDNESEEENMSEYAKDNESSRIHYSPNI